ncbi:MAG: hypothetical protein GTO24_15995, partial [candidate division Zixibacteria bacterium]|nr:hypothetical protein [candidate division Zixibacteria bacterium]
MERKGRKIDRRTFMKTTLAVRAGLTMKARVSDSGEGKLLGAGNPGDSMLDNTFNIIMKRMVESGQAPHYTEIAAELEVSMEEGRKALHDLFSAGVSGWLFPDTDYITSFAPFNNLP